MLISLQTNGSRAKNINGIRGKFNQLRTHKCCIFICTITDVHVGWQTSNTQTAIPSTSDVILASNTNNNNNTALAELDAMLAELDALLAPDTDPPNSTLHNTSLLLTELATASALVNGHLPNNSEGSDAGMYSKRFCSGSTSCTYLKPKVIITKTIAIIP